MRTLPTGVATASQLRGYNAALAVKLATTSPIRVTTYPSGLTISAGAYTYGYLAVGDSQLDDAPAVRVELANADNAISTADLDGTAGGGIMGKTVTLYEVLWDSSGTQLDPVPLFEGVVVEYSTDARVARLVCQNLAQTSAGFVGRIITRLCPYVFKGARCAYAGAETWCDHTHARCTTLANTGKYGGFRSMPTLGTQISYYLNEYVAGSAYAGYLVQPSAVIPQQPPNYPITVRGPAQPIPGVIPPAQPPITIPPVIVGPPTEIA